VVVADGDTTNIKPIVRKIANLFAFFAHLIVPLTVLKVLCHGKTKEKNFFFCFSHNLIVPLQSN